MIIKFEGKEIYSSSKEPVLILMDADELKMFKSLPMTEDIFASYPSTWTEEQARRWIEANKQALISEKRSQDAVVERDRLEADRKFHESKKPPAIVQGESEEERLATEPPNVPPKVEVKSDDDILSLFDEGPKKTDGVIEAKFEVEKIEKKD